MRRTQLIAACAGAAMASAALGQVSEIPDMTVDHTVADFDEMAVGPTTLGDINSTFGTDIADITLFEVGAGEGTDYGTNAFGNALKPDANGDLEIQAPFTETPGEMEGFEITLGGLSTEFGFSIGDRNGTIDTIEFYDGGDLVATYNGQLSMDGTIKYLQSDVPFDRVLVRESKDWVIPELVIEDTGSGCVADMDGDGDADVSDFFLFLDLFAAGDNAADINGDGSIDVSDFFAYLDAFSLGC